MACRVCGTSPAGPCGNDGVCPQCFELENIPHQGVTTLVGKMSTDIPKGDDEEAQHHIRKLRDAAYRELVRRYSFPDRVRLAYSKDSLIPIRGVTVLDDEILLSPVRLMESFVDIPLFSTTMLRYVPVPITFE